jgi:hypothetical protein
MLLSRVGNDYINKLDKIRLCSILPKNSEYEITMIFENDNQVITMNKNEIIKFLSLVYQYLPNRLSVSCNKLDLIVTDEYANRMATNNNYKILYTRKGILDSLLYQSESL